MKKVLLSSLTLLLTTISVFAYETVIIKFPNKENWVKAYYKKVGTEALLQYVPYGQSSNHWVRSVVIHSYKESSYPIYVFLTNSSAKLLKENPTAGFKTLRLTENDAIIGRCTEDYGKTKGQCEFFRATRGAEGIITIHYMNKDKDDFMASYNRWYDIVKRAKLYNSYYRGDRMLDKSEYFEL